MTNALEDTRTAVMAVAVPKRPRISEKEIDERMSVLEEYIGVVEQTLYDTRFDVEERERLRFGGFDEKKDVRFDGSTEILLREAIKAASQLKGIAKSGGIAMRFEMLEHRLGDINVYSKAYHQMLNTGKVIADRNKLYMEYTAPMDMRNNLLINPRTRAENRLRLHGKLAALARLKEMHEESGIRGYGRNFQGFMCNHENSWYEQILRTLETELHDYGDWELLGSFKKIMGRAARVPMAKPKSERRMEKPKEQRAGWFRKYAGKAAAFAAGVAVGVAGLIGYQNYSAPKNNVVNIVAEAPVSAVARTAEREEVKSDYSLDLNSFMDERTPKRTYNSLSLGDATVNYGNADKKDYSGLELNLR